MSPAADSPDDDTTAAEPGRAGPASLLSSAAGALRLRPRAAFALLVAGGVVAGLDWLALGDPVPTVAAGSGRAGDISVSFDVLVGVVSGASVPASSLVGLKTGWLACTLGLLVAELLVVAGTGLYALSRLLSVPMTRGAALRYGAVTAFVQVESLFRFRPRGLLHVETGPILGIPLIIGVVYVAVRLFALPGLLALGEPVLAAVRRSWGLTRGHGWSLGVVVVLLGVGNHLSVSASQFGALGTGVVAAVHAGVVAVFVVRQVPAADIASEFPPR